MFLVFCSKGSDKRFLSLLLDIIDLILSLSLDSNLVVRLAWEHEISHCHLAFCIQNLYATLVDEYAELADLAVGWSLGSSSKVAAEIHLTALGSIH